MKTDNQILKSPFKELSEEEQSRFFELKRLEIEEKFGKLVPKGTKTHTIVLENGLGCILNHPKPHVLSKSLGALSGINKEPDMYSAGNHIITHCWVAGDMEIQNNDDFRFACAIQALEMVEILQGQIKKN